MGAGTSQRALTVENLVASHQQWSAFLRKMAAEAQQPVVLRPTEAQLRWAQFHHKRAAAHVQERIAQLWLQPARVDDVPNARSDDGHSTDECSSEPRRRRKPLISKGRRALLRVSARSYEQRRQEIAVHGFRCGGDDDENDGSSDDDDALSAIFAESSFRRKKRKKRRLVGCGAGGTSDDAERVRRFEAAFYAMMSTLQHQQQSRFPEKIVATKKWMRPDGVGAMPSADGREYTDLKWGVIPKSFSKNPSKADASNFDRGASWLVHIPTKKNQPFTDAMRQHLAAVALRYLAEHDNGDDQETNDDVMSFVEQFERHVADDQLVTPRDVATFVARFEQHRGDGIPVQVLSPSTADLVIRFETPEQDKDGFVKRFVAQMEEAAVHEKLVSVDGKLHKPTFARLVQHYLCQVGEGRELDSLRRKSPGPANRSTLAGNGPGVDKSTAGAEDDNVHLPSFVQIFIEQMELDDEVDTIVTSEGTLNRPVFERLVNRYLMVASRRCLQEESSIADVAESKSTDSIREPCAEPAIPVRVFNFFGRIRNVGAAVNGFRFGREEPTAGPSVDMSAMVDVDETTGLDNEVPNAATKLVGSVSNKVGELFNSLNGKNNSDEAAYSAFRRAQDQRHVAEDGSSQSSFRVLPAGIRNVVKRFRRGKLAPQNDDDDDSEGKRETDCDASDHGTEALCDDEEPDFSNMMAGLNANQSIIDVDGSIISGDGTPAGMVARLMLSPTLLTKRHQQAIRAVESRNWDQVKYLLSANPWLAEMADVNTNQYVLHKLALYGAGQLGIDQNTGEVISIRYPASPEQINVDLVRLFPSSVHKFDRDGNLPLHMAASSAHLVSDTIWKA